jgi:hypothetical protein
VDCPGLVMVSHSQRTCFLLLLCHPHTWFLFYDLRQLIQLNHPIHIPGKMENAGCFPLISTQKPCTSNVSDPCHMVTPTSNKKKGRLDRIIGSWFLQHLLISPSSSIPGFTSY